MDGKASLAVLVCLAGIGALFILTLIAYRPPPPRGSASQDSFSARRAAIQLQAMVADGAPHPIGSPAGARLRGVILARLAELGYDTEVQSGFVCNEGAVCGVPHNIIARPHFGIGPAGNDIDRGAVLLAAHYDSVPAGPGASDDAAGVACLLEIANILRRARMLHPIVLLISDGEEAGLLGARLFVEHPLAKTIRAAVNLDARGSAGPSLMFETGSANSWLMSLYRRAIARPITDSVFYVAYKTLHNDTDFSVFKSAGWQGFNFAYIGDVSHYHTALDTLAAADLRSIQHQGDNALASVRALAASAELDSPPPGDAVYFDVLGRTVIEWSVRTTRLATAAVVLVLLLEIAWLVRRRRVSLEQLAWGSIGVIACPILAGTACTAVLLALLATGKAPPLQHYSWIAHPAGMHLLCAALPAGAAAWCAAWMSGRAGYWGAWSAAALLMGVASLLMAVVAPGLSFVPLLTAGTAAIAAAPAVAAVPAIAALPAVAAAPAAAGTVVDRESIALRQAGAAQAATWAALAATLAPAWMLFALLMPLLYLLYGAIGSVAWPIGALAIGWGASFVVPLLAAASTRLRRGIVTLSLAFALTGISLTALLPTYSPAWPLRLNFAYVLDQDAQRAFWVAQPDSLRLPTAVADAAAFDDVPMPLHSGSGEQGFRAAAPWSAMPAPQLSVRTATTLPSGIIRYELHAQSARGAPAIDVTFPRYFEARHLIFHDESGEHFAPLLVTRAATHLFLVGVPVQGVDFAIEARSGLLRAEVADQSFSIAEAGFLQHLRADRATASQDGDTTVVSHTVVLHRTNEKESAP